MADPATLIDRQTQLANFLVAGWPKLSIPGLPPVAAAAAVGNATQENQCKSVTEGAKDHGSDGLFQWRLDRLVNMQAFGDKWFGGWQSIEAQAAFFSFECKGDFPSLWSDLVQGAKSLATLTANIMAQYEKPAAESAMLDARIKYATTFMDAWTKPVVPVPLPAPAPAPVLVTPESTDPELAVLDQLVKIMLTAPPGSTTRIMAYLSSRF